MQNGVSKNVALRRSVSPKWERTSPPPERRPTLSAGSVGSEASAGGDVFTRAGSQASSRATTPDAEIAPPASFLEAIERGNAAFLGYPPQPEAAAALWLQARCHRRSPNFFADATDAQQHARTSAERGVLQLHLALHVPDHLSMRCLFEAAIHNNPSVPLAVDALIAVGARREVDRPLAQRIHAAFGPLHGSALHAQHTLVAALGAGDYDGAQALAGPLEQTFGHLLAPKAAGFICAFERDVVSAEPALVVRDEMRKSLRATELIGEVMAWTPEEHLRAMGGLTVRQHQEVWINFLERAYVLTPILYGARFVDGHTCVHPARAERTVFGLAWPQACALPLATPWSTLVRNEAPDAGGATPGPVSPRDGATGRATAPLPRSGGPAGLRLRGPASLIPFVRRQGGRARLVAKSATAADAGR